MLEQSQLCCWSVAIQQDIGGGLFGGVDVELAQVGQVGQMALAARFEDRVGRNGTNARNAQELLATGFHDLNGSLTQMCIGPGAFRIGLGQQVAILHKGEILDIEAIVAQQETGLIETMLAQWIGLWQVLKRRLYDWTEAGVVGSREPQIAVELLAEREELLVGILDRAHDKLGDGIGEALVGMLASNSLSQLQHGQQFVGEVFFGGQLAQAFLGRRLQVDRDAIGQLHRPVDLIVFRARHDLQMHVALVVVALPNDLYRIDNAILGLHSALDDARGQKKTIHLSCPLQCIEALRHLIGTERHALRFATSGPEGAIVAVAFAGCRQ